MKTYILERNKIFKNKYVRIWSILFISLLSITLPKIAFSFGQKIQFDKEFTYITLILMIIGFFILLINNFKLTKVGFLKLDKKHISIKINGLKGKIDINEINHLFLDRVQGNIYLLNVENHKLEIVLGEIELNQFETICKMYNIEIKSKSFISKITKDR